MKVWYEHAADHSANLRIVGRFKTNDDAQKAADLLNEVIDIVSKPQTPAGGGRFSKEILDFVNRTNFGMSYEAVDSAQFHYPVVPQGNQIEIQTDDVLIQLIIEAFVHAGGKIEIYSLHAYP